MRFFSAVFVGAALVASVFAVEINESPSNAEVGKTYTIKYSPADDTPTTFLLRKGESTDLRTLTTLTTSATGGTFEWTVDSSLVNGEDYALEIQQGGEFNYIGPFVVTGSSATSSASSSSASSTASSSSTESSSSTSASESTTLTSTGSTTLITSTASTNGTMSSRPSLSATPSNNATMTLRPTGTGTEATGTDSTGAPQNTGAASVLGSSPLALIFGAVAAMAYIN